MDANHGYGWVDGTRVPITGPVMAREMDPEEEAGAPEPGGWWPSEASGSLWLGELSRSGAAAVSSAARQELVHWLAGDGLHPVLWARRWGSALRALTPDLMPEGMARLSGGWLGYDQAALGAMFPREGYTRARRRLDAVWRGLGSKVAGPSRTKEAGELRAEDLGDGGRALEWAGMGGADGMGGMGGMTGAGEASEASAEAGAVARLAMGSLVRWVAADGAWGLPALKRFYVLVYYRYRDLAPGMCGDDFARVYGQGRAAWSADAERIMGRPLEDRLGWRPTVPGQKSAESRAAYAENARRHLPRRQLGGQAGLERACSADAEARRREAEDRARVARARREAEARELARDAEAMRLMAASARRRGKWTVNGEQWTVMKVAKASQEDVDALMNLMRVLNSADDEGFPCRPDGTWAEDDGDWFDVEDEQHLRKFYDRVMGCFAEHPGGLTRTVAGYHLAMTNGVFDPDADTYEWAPDLAPVVAARTKH
jgi:hypothetical protein